MAHGDYLFTSESVTEGHPDKLADQISDGVLDAALAKDPKARVACETFVSVGLVLVGGEITTEAYIDINSLVRDIVHDVGYVDPHGGFTWDSCSILNAIGTQSPDIAMGVDVGGAGDQGLMIGYAVRETPELMPMPIQLAHKLSYKLARVRHTNKLDWLGPDGKSQVTIEYRDHKPYRIDSVLISTQHTEAALDRKKKKMAKARIDELIETVVKPVLPRKMVDNKTRYLVNPTGRFIVGGPQSDAGVTGRKIIVDTYGGRAAHGGGAFSGKDPTKVDRSACYMARYIAKNLVAAGLADECTVQLAYAIGVKEPMSLMIDTHGTSNHTPAKLVKLVRKHFDMTPKGIIETLDLLRPIYRPTAAYGHFGRTGDSFTWERTDKADHLREDAN